VAEGPSLLKASYAYSNDLICRMHPGTKPEDLEKLAGVEQISGRVGLINVAREMDKLKLGEQGKPGEKK
jgi:hypothetical protein